MRKLLVLAAGISAVLAVPAQAPAQDNDAHVVIDKAIKAIGGLDKAKSLKAFTAKIKGNVSVMGMDLDFTLDAYTQPPGKSKAVINVDVGGQQLQIIQVFNEDKGWISAAGQVMELDKETLDEHKAMVHVESVTSLFSLKEDKAMKLSPLGESKVGATPVVGVQVTKEGKRDVNLYFDKKSHLLLKAEYRAIDQFSKQEVNQEKIFTEYKELLPGLKLPSKQVINNDGKKAMDLEFIEVRAVDRHDDSVFAKPQ